MAGRSLNDKIVLEYTKELFINFTLYNLCLFCDPQRDWWSFYTRCNNVENNVQIILRNIYKSQNIQEDIVTEVKLKNPLIIDGKIPLQVCALRETGTFLLI